ncbi:CC0125/CC1285 family lipoprotein [Teredinibacter waterburyi]|uniref:CC0125/CC1285 family lipoprotein n=1 Tax=Teredinibacter waterburyi TaxID=1500538 RepID=UPI00165FCBB1|nr:hypothetical protein [Teredinibacter waterburyi]
MKRIWIKPPALLTFSLLTFSFLTLTGCASNSGYQKAAGYGYGYSETVISDNRYRVDYKARNKTNSTVRHYALRRAAELTLEKGYDWFVVVDRDLQLEQSNNTIQTSMSKMSERESATKRCGLLGCTTEPYPASSYGMGLHTDTGDRATKAIASLEIRLGKGVRPENVESYDAREVRDNLSRQ